MLFMIISSGYKLRAIAKLKEISCRIFKVKIIWNVIVKTIIIWSEIIFRK